MKSEDKNTGGGDLYIYYMEGISYLWDMGPDCHRASYQADCIEINQ